MNPTLKIARILFGIKLFGGQAIIFSVKVNMDGKKGFLKFFKNAVKDKLDDFVNIGLIYFKQEMAWLIFIHDINY